MKSDTKYRLKEALSITLMMFVTLISINLLFELITVEQYRGLGFSQGHITVSGKKVGHHIFAYILAFLIGFGSLFYSSKEIPIK